MGRVTVSRPVTRFTVGVGATRRPDTLVAEEPLEIRLNGSPLAVTMRTPGDDVNLAHGFLLTEGVISVPGDVHSESVHRRRVEDRSRCKTETPVVRERTEFKQEFITKMHVEPQTTE